MKLRNNEHSRTIHNRKEPSRLEEKNRVMTTTTNTKQKPTKSIRSRIHTDKEGQSFPMEIVETTPRLLDFVRKLTLIRPLSVTPFFNFNRHVSVQTFTLPHDTLNIHKKDVNSGKVRRVSVSP